MSKILISYRREDSAHVTGRIYDRLSQQFGRTAVFKDVDNIPLGIDFRTYLDQQIAKCDVFLAIIGRHWMKPQGQKGRSRLADPADFVRLEIEAALKRQIPVIPVLVEGASIPAVDRLPTSLQGLSYRNGIVVRPDPDFHRDMDRLIEHLREQIERKQENLPPLEVPHTASNVSSITKVTSSKIKPPGQESVEAARQSPEVESQPVNTPSQEGAPVAFLDTHSAVRHESAIGERPPSEVERMEQESVEIAVRPSELDSQQRQGVQVKDEGAALTPPSRATTDRSRSYILGGLGLIALIGIVVVFLSLQQSANPDQWPPLSQNETTPKSGQLSSTGTSTSSELSARVATSVSPQESLAPESTKMGADPPDQVRYDQLLRLFGAWDLDFEAAIQGLSRFLVEFPNSNLVPNAQFWLGQAYFRKKDFQEAIVAYDKVVIGYPGSEKAPAAILKMGYAYLELKDKRRASSAFKQVVTLYPKTDEAGKASHELAKLKDGP